MVQNKQKTDEEDDPPMKPDGTIDRDIVRKRTETEEKNRLMKCLMRTLSRKPMNAAGTNLTTWFKDWTEPWIVADEEGSIFATLKFTFRSRKRDLPTNYREMYGFPMDFSWWHTTIFTIADSKHKRLPKSKTRSSETPKAPSKTEGDEEK